MVYLCVGLALLAIGGTVGAWASYRIYAAPARADATRFFAELDGTRRALEGTRERSLELERRIGELESVARTVETGISEAIVGAGRITDTSRRVVYLVGRLRAILGSLRITGSGDAP